MCRRGGKKNKKRKRKKKGEEAECSLCGEGILDMGVVILKERMTSGTRDDCREDGNAYPYAEREMTQLSNRPFLKKAVFVPFQVGGKGR